jgi:hypothetical protein
MPAQRRFSHRFKRFRQWLKQVILLGRVDWRKASDDASPPRLSREEREELRPRFDVNAIKPRAVTVADRAINSQPEAPPAVPTEPTAAAPDPSRGRRIRSRVFRRHHHERSHQIAVNPLSAFSSDKLPATRFERLLEKVFGRRG